MLINKSKELCTMNMSQSDDHQYKCEIFTINEFQRATYNLLMESPRQIRQCIRAAVIGLMKSLALVNIDNEMAILRIITAEEEASTAIIHALKRRGYKNSNLLNHRNHNHKHAIWPFFVAFTGVLQVLDGKIEGQLVFEPDEISSKLSPKIRFRFVGQSHPGYFYPIPPLDMELHLENGQEKSLYDFETELKKLATDFNCNAIIDHINKEANFRNQVLYASQEGLPRIEGNVRENILARGQRIFTMMAICLLIDFYPQKQLLVQQLCDSLVKNCLCIQSKLGASLDKGIEDV